MNNRSMNDFVNNDYKSLADFLFSFSGNEFAIIAAITGYIISQNLAIDEVNSLGNFFELIGQMMLSIASQNQVLHNQQTNMNDNNGIIGR